MAESRVAIYGAIAVNVAIASTKIRGCRNRGQLGDVSEDVHSAVDTFNGVLLLVYLPRPTGQARS